MLIDNVLPLVITGYACSVIFGLAIVEV